ncbi:hypothetical protein [Paracoccus pacificus]|uniref:Uncharacterized protein n=1 Tax=Paracoccus pacificus TaxID=1463598 RepID=A0ABW4RAH6_9RHOB
MLRALSILIMLSPLPAFAEAGVFLVDRGTLPFDLGPGHPANSPALFANRPTNNRNSAANPLNGAANRANLPSVAAQGTDLIVTDDGTPVGYYVQNGLGTMNLFDAGGKRIAYKPANRSTKSLFTTSGQWCGTVAAARDGTFSIGLTRACAALFGLQ